MFECTSACYNYRQDWECCLCVIVCPFCDFAMRRSAPFPDSSWGQRSTVAVYRAESQRSLSSCLEWALKHVARLVYTTSLKKTNLESLDDLGKDYDDCSQKLHDLCHWIYASDCFTLFPPDYVGHVQRILWHPNTPCHKLTHWHTSHSEGMQCPLCSKLSQHAFLCVL